MAFIDEYGFDMLKNEAEKLVINEIEEQLKTGNEEMCRCNECIVDIGAIALSSVKPIYHSSLLGTLYASKAMSEGGYADSVKNAVEQAIEKVKKNPAHD